MRDYRNRYPDRQRHHAARYAIHFAHLASLAGIAPELAVAAATGSNARVYRLNCGLLSVSKVADVVLLDTPDGGTQSDALSAIRNGDIAAIGAVITSGVPRFVGRSRNTPPTTRKARATRSSVMQDFAPVSS